MRARDKKARDGVATGEKKRLLRTRLKSIEQTPSRARPFRSVVTDANDRRGVGFRGKKR
jgi:hypothetical protein